MTTATAQPATLFDLDVERKPLAPQGIALPAYDFLNRSDDPAAGRVRSLMEEFFSDYPTADKLDLLKRFRSKKRDQHVGAAFELVLHATLRRLGCAVTSHPAAAEGKATKPDFRAEPSDGSSSFYVEARVATGETTEDAKLRDAMDLLYERLSGFDSSDFFINIVIRNESEVASLPAAKTLKGFLREQLNQYSWEQGHSDLAAGGLQAMPRWVFREADWVIEFMPQPKSIERRGSPDVKPLGFKMEGMSIIDSPADIRTALEKKASKYGALDLPFVVGINVLEHCDERLDALPAFYGTENFVFNPATGEAEQHGNLRDGTWMGHGGPQNLNVSAVLLGSPIYPWNLAEAPVRLWHHPFASRPYTGVLTALPQAVYRGDQVEFLPGRALRDVLGLPSGWPR